MMIARIIASGWWIVVMGFVCATAIAAVLLSYAGLLDIIAQNFSRGAGYSLAGVALATICALLCRHRTDLLV